MSKKNTAEQVEQVEQVELVNVAPKEQKPFTLETVNVHTLVPTRDWRRSLAVTSHLSGILEWYGEKDSYITCFKNEFGKYEILQGNQRCKALINEGAGDITVKMYGALTEAERLELSADIIATSLDRLDVYRALWFTLKGVKSITQWLKAISAVGFKQVMYTTRPKSGDLAFSDKEKTAIVNARKKVPAELTPLEKYEQAVSIALLSNRWQGMRQSIEKVAKASPEVAELFEYGIKARNAGFYTNLPASCVTVNEKTDKNGKITYSYEVDFNDPNLQKCAELGVKEYALLPEADLFIKPETSATANKGADEKEPLVDIDINMEEFIEYVGAFANSSKLQLLIYRLFTADIEGVAYMKSYVAEVGATTN